MLRMVPLPRALSSAREDRQCQRSANPPPRRGGGGPSEGRWWGRNDASRGAPQSITTASSMTGRRLRGRARPDSTDFCQSRIKRRNPCRWGSALAISSFICPEPPDQRLHEADGAFRVVLDRRDELLVGRGGHSTSVTALTVAERGPGSIRHISPNTSRSTACRRPRLGALADFDLDRSIHDVERRIALVPFGDDDLSGLERHGSHARLP